MTSQMLSGACCLAPPLLQARLRGSALLGGLAAPPPPWLPPASPCSVHCLSALPTLFRGPLIYAWLQRIRSAGLLEVFWVIYAGVGGS